MSGRKGLSVDVRVGESFRLDIKDQDDQRQCVMVTLEQKAGQCARLRIIAAESVRIVLPKAGLPVLEMA